jgi:hypothetical protein
MNIKNLKNALPVLFKAKVVPLIIGAHGVGKSQAIAQHAKETGVGFIDLRLGLMEPGDLLGLADLSKGVTSFARPAWLPTEGAGVIFLDEFNRARRDTLQAIFQLILDRRIHDYELPPGWHVVAACNPDSGEYSVTDVSDKALMDRFCLLRLQPSSEEFQSHGRQREFDPSVLGFLADQPGLLEGKAKDDDMISSKKPSRRSWDALSRVLKENPPEEILREITVGLVGQEAASAFLAFLKNFDTRIDAKDVLDRYTKVQPKVLKLVELSRVDALANVCQEIAEICEGADLSDKRAKNLVKFLCDMPGEVLVASVTKLLPLSNLATAIGNDDELLAAVKRAKAGAPKAAKAAA